MAIADQPGMQRTKGVMSGSHCGEKTVACDPNIVPFVATDPSGAMDPEQVGGHKAGTRTSQTGI